MEIDLGYTETDSRQRVKEAQDKKTAKDYEPTWEEVWSVGWTRYTGTFKKPIFKTRLTETDRERLLDVKHAVENGEISSGVENMKKFSKSHALNLFKQLKLARRDGIVQDMLDHKPDNYFLINTENDLQHVVELLRSEDLIALDTETTGVEFKDTTVGMSISFEQADEHVYIPYGHITDVEQIKRERVMSVLKPELERSGLKIVLFNAKFDVKMLRKDGIFIRENAYFDVMIAMHVLNENENKFGLKPLTNKYGKFFGYNDDSMGFSELFGKDPIEFIKADIMVATVYACKDTHLTLLFYKWQMEMFEKQPKLKHVYFDLEQKNTHVALEMELNGFNMDLDFAKQYSAELKEQVEGLKSDMQALWGDLNTNSNKQLAELFYDSLGYEDVSGKRSVNAKTLKTLAKKHSDVQKLLDYRDISKLYSTYVEPLPDMVQDTVKSPTGVTVEGDGRLHGTFMQTGTVTGRWASKEPNLQNLPPRARRMVTAPKGKLLIGIDYSQIEPRVLASLSGDKDFRAPYIDGGDLYVQIASDVYNIPYDNCLESDDTYWREKTSLPKHPRKLAKVILLAVMYGIHPISLADTIQSTPEEAQAFIDQFYKSYPVVRDFMDKVVARADKQGYVETADGRKRRFLGHKTTAKQYHAFKKKIEDKLGEVPDFIWDAGNKLPYKLKRGYWDVSLDYSKVERMSVNAVIQGSAADILKKAMIKAYEHLQDKDGWKMVGTIHDEILFEIPDTATVAEIKKLNEIMVNVTKLNVPVKSDVEIMTEWGSGIDFEEWIEKGKGRKPFEEAK